MQRPDLGLGGDPAVAAIAIFVKDQTLNSLRFAQDHGAAYLNVSTGSYEMGPEVALFVHRPQAAAILMDSTWLAGAATLPTLHFAKDFSAVDEISIAALLAPDDLGGPAATADYERLLMASPRAMYLADGEWRWTSPDDPARTVRSVGGESFPVTPYSPFDLLSLSGATRARSIRFDFAMGNAANGTVATEIIIDIAGVRADGAAGRSRYALVHPQGQGPVTALGVSVGIERLLGLAGGPPVAPGLYLPEVLIDPAYMVERLEEFGVVFRRLQ